MTAPDDPSAPRWRSFVARRLDRQPHWLVSTDAADDDLDEVLRAVGYDRATRSPGQGCAPPSETEEDTSLAGRRRVRVMAEIGTDCVENVAGEGCLRAGGPSARAARAPRSRRGGHGEARGAVDQSHLASSRA